MMFAADLVAARVAERGAGGAIRQCHLKDKLEPNFLYRVYFEQIASNCASRPARCNTVINVKHSTSKLYQQKIDICTVKVQQRFPSRYADHYAIYCLFPLEN